MLNLCPTSNIRLGVVRRMAGYPIRRILDAGKSVQIIRVRPDEVAPLLDAVGGAGMYIMTQFDSEREAERLCRQVEAYR